MPTLVIELADLEHELNAIPIRDQKALALAIQRTVQVDAHRWIQWSIRGGGAGSSINTRPVAPPGTSKKPSRTRKKTARAAMRKAVRTAVRALYRRLGTQPPPKSRVPKKPKNGPSDSARPPSGYRIPIDTGDYANSWKYISTPTGGMIWSSASPAIKAGVIEHGRRPAPIPIAPLADWVRRKLGVQDPKQARGIAIAISKRAAKQRREGLKVLERAHPKIAQALATNVKAELRKMVATRAQ